MKRHIKRINAPKTWKILKKEQKFIRRPNPGAHSFNIGTSIMTLFKEISPVAKTAREVRQILNTKEVFVNGKRVKNPDYLTGFMDIISIPSENQYKLLTLDKKGFLNLEDIDKKHSEQKMAKLSKKSLVKGKIQLNFVGGETIIADKKNNYKIGDTFVIGLKDKKIIKKIALEKGSNTIVYLGKRIGVRAKVLDLKENIAFLESQGKKFETNKKYLFAVE